MYNYYVVQRGDTLYSIANMFNTTVYQLRLLNNFSNNKTLGVGEVLIVPVNNVGNNDNMNNMIPNSNENLFDNYVVEKGDSIYSISSKYDISSNILMYLNGLNNSFLRPGQVLIVPKRQVSVFITREGDSIQSVLNEKQIDIRDLLNYNNNIYLLPNQVLIYRSN